MSNFIQFTAIVPAASAEAYRHAASLVHPSAAGMFITPLYTGDEVTHYISTGLIDSQFCEIVTDPVTFANATGFTVGQGQELRDGFTYLAVGFDSEEGDAPPLHNDAAILNLGLSKALLSD